MTIKEVIKLLDKAWTESWSRFEGASDEPEKIADAPSKVDGDSDLGQALGLLDQAWEMSRNRFRRDDQLKRLEALFPLYLLEQIHRSRSLSFEEWMAWIEQVRSDLVSPGELTVPAGDFNGLLEKVGRLIDEFRAESEEITPRLFDQEGASHADC